MQLNRCESGTDSKVWMREDKFFACIFAPDTFMYPGFLFPENGNLFRGAAGCTPGKKRDDLPKPIFPK